MIASGGNWGRDHRAEGHIGVRACADRCLSDEGLTFAVTGRIGARAGEELNGLGKIAAIGPGAEFAGDGRVRIGAADRIDHRVLPKGKALKGRDAVVAKVDPEPRVGEDGVREDRAVEVAATGGDAIAAIERDQIARAGRGAAHIIGSSLEENTVLPLPSAPVPKRLTPM